MYLMQVWGENEFVPRAGNSAIHTQARRGQCANSEKMVSPLDQGETSVSKWLQECVPNFMPLPLSGSRVWSY